MNNLPLLRAVVLDEYLEDLAIEARRPGAVERQRVFFRTLTGPLTEEEVRTVKHIEKLQDRLKELRKLRVGASCAPTGLHRGEQ